ncbi:MAG: hypothetical protein ACLFU8_15310 [Anaerolineales bacterium]
MKERSPLLSAILINGALFLLLALGGRLAGALLGVEALSGSTFNFYAAGLGALQFIVNMVLAILLYVKERHEWALACFAAGSVIPFVGTLLIRLLQSLF